MKTKKTYNTILFTVLWIVIAVLALTTIVYTATIISNKRSTLTFDKFDDTDKMMLETLSGYLKNADGTVKTFNIPIAFVRDYGIARGRAYLFNHNITECKGAFGLRGGTFATEILLSDDMNLPTMYRLSTFSPGLGSYLFPSDFKTVNLCGTETYVIGYDNNSLNDGTFVALLKRVMSNNG